MEWFALKCVLHPRGYRDCVKTPEAPNNAFQRYSSRLQFSHNLGSDRVTSINNSVDGEFALSFSGRYPVATRSRF
jgi:hypothetical protein